MHMNAIVLNGDVLESTFYDQVTGAPRQGYSVKLVVIDADTYEKYECQFNGGFPELEELKQLRQQNGTTEQFDDALARLRQNLPADMAQLAFEVVKVKGKGSFLTLVCRFAQVAATV
jgi:predicted Rdx family selenoprotein